MMKNRVLVPEWMDDPQLARDDHFRALQALARINRWSGNAALAWRSLRAVARACDKHPLRVLDVATGAADIPIGMLRRAERCGLELTIDACDISHQAIEFARLNCEKAGVKVRLFQLDAVADPLRDHYDVVMCSQFLHHLTDDAAERVLGNMIGAAELQVVVIDLVRGWWNWYQVWFATRVLTRSKIVHFDGPHSIRAAFTTGEMASIARRAGLHDVEIRKHWPCRFVLTGRPG